MKSNFLETAETNTNKIKISDRPVCSNQVAFTLLRK